MKFDSSALLVLSLAAAVGTSVSASKLSCTTSIPNGLVFGPYEGDPQCVKDLKFDYGWKMEYCQDGSFPLNLRAYGGGLVSGSCPQADEIILDVTCTHKSANIEWKGLGNNKAVVKVKGGTGGTIYSQQYTMQGLIAGMDGGFQLAEIDDIEICLQCVPEQCTNDDAAPKTTKAVAAATPTEEEHEHHHHHHTDPTPEPKAETLSPTSSPTDVPTSAPTTPTTSPTKTPTFAVEAEKETISPTSSPSKEHHHHHHHHTADPKPEQPKAETTLSSPTESPTTHPDVELFRGNKEPDDPILQPKPLQGASYGDPHFTTWNGTVYDFHGGCDLVLVDAPNYDQGTGLLVHVRTKIITWWSYIDSAVIRIGKDTFEIKGGHDQVHYWINGKPGVLKDSGMVESKVHKYPIKFRNVSKKQKSFRFQGLPQGVGIAMESFGDFVRVKVWAKNKKQFRGARGLLGSYPDGAMVSRDGETIITDPIAFGKEWQVRLDEDHLFHNLEGAQHPQQCTMPTEGAEEGRRLSESSIQMEDAKIACADVDPLDFDACVFDVLATSDMELAGSYGSY